MTLPAPGSARRVRVRGRVQGVGFRDACIDEARRNGIAGWVRNRVDGSVELLIAAEPARLDAYLAWLRDGVRFACVDAIDIAPAEWPGGSGFDRRPTE